MNAVFPPCEVVPTQLNEKTMIGDRASAWGVNEVVCNYFGWKSHWVGLEWQPRLLIGDTGQKPHLGREIPGLGTMWDSGGDGKPNLWAGRLEHA